MQTSESRESVGQEENVDFSEAGADLTAVNAAGDEPDTADAAGGSPDQDETGSEATEINSDNGGTSDRRRQSREENKAYAAARRSAEKERDALITEMEESARALGFPSWEAYRQALTADAGQADNTQVNIENVGEITRPEQSDRMASDRTAAQTDWAAEKQKRLLNEMFSLSQAYPEVELKALLKDRKFKEFADKRAGPLIERYRDYRAFVNGVEEEALRRMEKKTERSMSGPVAGGDGNYGLTGAEQSSLAQWNKRYPELKMTPKEWAKRRD